MKPAAKLLVLATVASACGGATPLEGGLGSPIDDHGTDGSATASKPPRGATFVYFYARPVDGGQIYAVPAGGGASSMLAAGRNGHTIADAFAFDNANVYYSDEYRSADVESPLAGSVLALPFYPGSAQTLVQGLENVTAIAVDNQNVYFVNWHLSATDSAGFIGRVAKTGGVAEHLVNLLSTQAVSSLTVDGNFLYWSQLDGAIRRIPVSGGISDTLASGELRPGGIAVGADEVYWFSRGTQSADCVPLDGAVRQVANSGGKPITLAAGLAGVSSLALGGQTVFWSTSGPFCNVGGQGLGSVFSIVGRELVPRPVAIGLTGPSQLFVGGTTLYFTNVIDENTDALGPIAIIP